jgi:hypothetical protein
MRKMTRGELREWKARFENLPGEEWKPVSFAPRYMVSNYGRAIGPHGPMKPTVNDDGYPQIKICVDGTAGSSKSFKVHRLVAAEFIPPVAGKPFINHKNGVKNENDVENLEWCTFRENVIHGYRVLGRTDKLGEGQAASKLTDVAVREIRRLVSEHWPHTRLARMFNVSIRCIGLVAARKSWKHV